MTSWLRKYDNPVLLFLLLAANITSGSSHSGERVCSSPPISSCSECLQRGPRCAWCFQERFLDGAEVGERCDLAVTLARRGCGLEFIEHPEIMVEVNPTTSRTQVSPGEITLTLRPGAEASVVVAVQQLERYPVDLYSLVDVSASMQDNLDQLKKVGVALSTRMREHSSDLRLGFGSFVDKNVSPYINVHPSKLNNPCSDYEVKCLPAHGFHHVLSMTSNMSEFTRIIKRQRISGNMDTPEGGLDAMLQATVCQGEVGWRGEAKRLLLLMTDQPSHLALDSRLAGIVTPHDGLCHLENSVYMKSSTMDHPSLGLLAEKLLENHIYSLFAVEQLQYQWYELKKVGVALSTRMREHSSDLRLGFGSFVDKNVSPYINVHPSKLNNPCSDYEVKCLPAHGFHHVLSMTSNMSEFTRIIKRQRISGNMDTPEGGLDAMLQATVCQGEVGWRGEAKRLLLLMTDQPSHLALDSRLAGIVTPHDGLCHLENSVYMKSSTMDHPSLGLLAEKLLENHIYSLFAVEQLQYQWYEELVTLLPGSSVLFQAPNLIDLVVDAYKCVSRGRYMRMFVSVCVLTFLSGLVMIAVLVLLLQRRSLPQGGATDPQYNPTGKDQSYIPTTNEKTTSYWRNCPLDPDQPMEMCITIPKMSMGEAWQ